ncbi:pyridoxamine 5'-phosphate oxidase family protein [Rhodococcus sp. 14-2470-1b]|uniref:pyridoxamine 5'-phosphate oxidase family protein n=1 Tax=Rhodococcus sp. 14-2470-1b TaxID=2023149 RepID=UPI001C3E580C|nr:pyridoxamine 5'-phosphate oxidase family protein [Rhodococcus sp. 14-2470-1b]
MLATLHADGAPRVSGIEIAFLDGEIQFGMLYGSRKLADIRRDPRVALHAATLAPAGAEEMPVDAKISGRAEIYVGRIDQDYPDAAQLRIDLTHASYIQVDPDTGAMKIDTWRYH